MTDKDQPMRKYGVIKEDDRRAKNLPKTADAKEKEARRTSIKPEKKD